LKKTLFFSGSNVLANRLAKLELEIVKLKEYLEDFLPKIASSLCKEPATETVNTTSIPPLPCNEKEDVDNLEEWLEVEQNQDLLVSNLKNAFKPLALSLSCIKVIGSINLLKKIMD
jgi:hypothetical protein